VLAPLDWKVLVTLLNIVIGLLLDE